MAITANSGEYKSRIGLDSLYIAEVTVDTAAAYTADTPEWLAPAAEASQEPSSSFEIQYADDQPYDVSTSEADTKIAMKVTGVPLEMLAKLSGKRFDAVTGRMYDYGGTPPYMALSFRSKKSNGSYRYYQFLKGKFDLPKEETTTLGEKPEPKTMDLNYTAIRTVHQFSLGGGITDTVKRVVGDDDTTNFDETGWFTQVQTPTSGSAAALALSSSVPSSGSSGVAVSSNVTMTFNNALIDAAIYAVNLMKNTGVTHACTNSLDTTRKIMTVNPDTNLDASSTYIMSYGVTDIYGDTLVGSFAFGTA